MRVISGIYKGRNLIAPTDNEVRPTSAMVKEAIFGKLQFQIADTLFLDLFSGTGAMGIEAISRGAREVYFADNSYKSIKLIESNLKKIGVEANVINASYEITLKMMKDKQFDFIFIDPPYALDCIDKILELVTLNNVLSIDGIIIFEHLKEKVLKLASTSYIIIDEKKYSGTMVSYIKRNI